MGFFDRYTQVDRTLMEDGAEVDFGDGFFVTIRHVSSKKVEMARSRKLQEMKVMGRNRELTADQNKELMAYTVSEGGIVGWRGGDAPEFTPVLAEQIFKDRPEFLEDIITVMTTYEAFRRDQVEDASGNSSESSSGGSSTGSTSKRSSTTDSKASQ
jgi:hypothetical protein